MNSGQPDSFPNWVYSASCPMVVEQAPVSPPETLNWISGRERMDGTIDRQNKIKSQINKNIKCHKKIQ